MSDIRYEFIMSQIKHIRDIKENEKTKISLVYYEGCQRLCILKICKNRDLSEVYQALMEVKHPNVAQVYDCVYADGDTYVIEEFIGGQTVADILSTTGTFSEKETTKIIMDVCDGLDVLHGQEPPIIHNDIKASNIMITEDGNAKIFDFDISRTYKEDSHKNTRLMGTYEYAAPEHYGFGQSDPRTDIYSLGVTMHEMLVSVGLDTEHNTTYQGSLVKIIKRCVEIDRKKRYASAAILKKALERYQFIQGRVFKMFLALVAVVLLLVVGSIFLQNHIREMNMPQDDTGQIGSDLSENTEDADADLDTENDSMENTEGLKEDIETESEKTEDVSEESTQGNINGGHDNSGTSSGQGTVNNTEKEEVTVSKKPVKTVYKLQGKFLTMQVWPNGDILWLEKKSEDYYIRDSYGKEKLLEGIKAARGAELLYSWDADQMYLWTHHYTDDYVYSVNKDLEIELIEPSEVSEDAIPRLDYLFTIKDKQYSIMCIQEEYVFLEMDNEGNAVNDFPLKGLDLGGLFGESGQFFNNGKAVYFLARYEGGEEYLYSFDGENCKHIACLNDYENFGQGLTYLDLYVTDTVFGFYSYLKDAILEYEIE